MKNIKPYNDYTDHIFRLFEILTSANISFSTWIQATQLPCITLQNSSKNPLATDVITS